MGSYIVRSDIEKNILFVTMSGSLTPQETRLCADLIISAASNLAPGFDMVSDVSRLTLPTDNQDAAKEAIRAQLYLQQNGLGRVIRIVDHIALAQIKLERQSREAGYKAELASTQDEALRMLGLE